MLFKQFINAGKDFGFKFLYQEPPKYSRYVSKGFVLYISPEVFKALTPKIMVAYLNHVDEQQLQGKYVLSVGHTGAITMGKTDLKV